MKPLPGAVWVDDKKLTAYEKYTATLTSKLVLDADGLVWDKPPDDPKRKQQAIAVGGVLFDKPEADGGVAVGRIIADQPWFTDGDKLLDGPKLEGKKPKQIGIAI